MNAYGGILVVAIVCLSLTWFPLGTLAYEPTFEVPYKVRRASPPPINCEEDADITRLIPKDGPPEYEYRSLRVVWKTICVLHATAHGLECDDNPMPLNLSQSLLPWGIAIVQTSKTGAELMYFNGGEWPPNTVAAIRGPEVKLNALSLSKRCYSNSISIKPAVHPGQKITFENGKKCFGPINELQMTYTPEVIVEQKDFRGRVTETPTILRIQGRHSVSNEIRVYTVGWDGQNIKVLPSDTDLKDITKKTKGIALVLKKNGRATLKSITSLKFPLTRINNVVAMILKGAAKYIFTGWRKRSAVFHFDNYKLTFPLNQRIFRTSFNRDIWSHNGEHHTEAGSDTHLPSTSRIHNTNDEDAPPAYPAPPPPPPPTLPQASSADSAGGSLMTVDELAKLKMKLAKLKEMDEKIFKKLKRLHPIEYNKDQANLQNKWVYRQPREGDEGYANRLVKSWKRAGIEVVAFDFDGTLIASNNYRGGCRVRRLNSDIKLTDHAEKLIQACWDNKVGVWIASNQDSHAEGDKELELTYTKPPPSRTPVKFQQSHPETGKTVTTNCHWPTKVQKHDIKDTNPQYLSGAQLLTYALTNSNLLFGGKQSIGIVTFLPDNKSRPGSGYYTPHDVADRPKIIHLQQIARIAKVEKGQVMLIDDRPENYRTAVEYGFVGAFVQGGQGIVLDSLDA